MLDKRPLCPVPAHSFLAVMLDRSHDSTASVWGRTLNAKSARRMFSRSLPAPPVDAGLRRQLS